MFFQNCIAPHFFQLIKLTLFGHHDVNNNIHIVQDHPMHIFFAFIVVWRFTAFFLYFIFNKIGDGSDLWLVIGLADHKEICNSLMYFSKIKGNDVIALFFLNSLNDGFKNLRIPV